MMNTSNFREIISPHWSALQIQAGARSGISLFKISNVKWRGCSNVYNGETRQTIGLQTEMGRILNDNPKIGGI